MILKVNLWEAAFWNQRSPSELQQQAATTSQRSIPKDFNLFGRDNLNIILITEFSSEYSSFRIIFASLTDARVFAPNWTV